MVNADLAIGQGVPCGSGAIYFTAIIADNQIEIAKTVAAQGAIWNLGLPNEVNVDRF